METDALSVTWGQQNSPRSHRGHPSSSIAGGLTLTLSFPESQTFWGKRKKMHNFLAQQDSRARSGCGEVLMLVRNPQCPAAAGKRELSQHSRKAGITPGLCSTLPSFLQTSGNEESGLTSRPCCSEQAICLFVPEHLREIPLSAALGIKEGFAWSCGESSAFPSWPAMRFTQLQALLHSQTVRSKQRQQHEADADGSCAFAWEVKWARRRGLAGHGGVEAAGHLECVTGHQLARQSFAASSRSFPGSAHPSRSLHC